MNEESRVPFETQPTGLETAPAPLESRPPREVSLFWRTFFLLAMLLVGWFGWRATANLSDYILGGRSLGSVSQRCRPAPPT